MKSLFFILVTSLSFTLACGGDDDKSSKSSSPTALAKKITKNSSGKEDAQVMCDCMESALQKDDLEEGKKLAEECAEKIEKASDEKFASLDPQKNEEDVKKMMEYGVQLKAGMEACEKKLGEKYKDKLAEMQK